MNVLAAYTVYQWKRYVRAPITLCWAFALPVTLLLIFGSMTVNLQEPYGHTTVDQVGTLSPAYAGYLTMGLIGLNTVSIGIFGLGIVLVQARDLGILRRLTLTPQPAWKFVAGQLLASSAIVVLSTALLLTVGIVFFDVSLPRRLPDWSIVLGLGCVTFLTIGYALAALMREVRTAQVAGNTIFLLLMCLGGVWFPLESLPAAVRWIGLALPLSHFLNALRSVGCVGQPLAAHLQSVTVLVVWSLIAGIIAVWQFRKNQTF